MADNILKISSDYKNGVDKLTTSSIYAVNEVYKIAHGSLCNLTTTTNANSGVTIKFTKNDTNADPITVVIGTITAQEAKTGTETIPKTISAKVLDTKINDEITERLTAYTDVEKIANLGNVKNGWYYISSDTILGVTGAWMVQKVGAGDTLLYTATSMKDPRIVLNSKDLTTWYSPYGSWHV
jgi:hypothetical protein